MGARPDRPRPPAQGKSPCSILFHIPSPSQPPRPSNPPARVPPRPRPAQVRAAAKSCVSTHDLANLRADLLATPFHGAVPHEVRGTVWLLLLRLRLESLLAEHAPAFAHTAREAVADHNSKEQIEKDVARTRPALARFKQPAVRGALLRLLSLFCVRHNVAYVQGFNELLAPFVLLADTGGNPRIVFALFSEFVSRFAPWMLETSESRVFDVLKRMFKYFGRLLLYHDPELYWQLERHMMTPDLYATSWFVTLFARNFTVESVLALWDLLLLEDNPLGTSFFGIALLCSKRDQLLSVDESRIPETLMMLTANSPQEVRTLWNIGSKMRTAHTPPSFQRLMTDRLLQTPGTKHTRVGLSAARAMQASVCLQTTPDDLVAGEAHYFTWDCRTQDEYNAGHLAQAAFLPLDALRNANGKITSETNEAARTELQSAVDLCEPLKDSSHICLVGSGIREEDNLDINMLALYLTRIGIRYVSTLRGGFQEALHTATNSEDNLSSVELVDFDKKKYERARKARIAAQAKRKQETERKIASAKQDQSSNSAAAAHTLVLSGDRKIGATQDEHSTQASKTSSSEASAASSSPSGMQSISSFLEKTDAEVSRAVNKALAGMGLRYSLSAMSSKVSGERESGGDDKTPSSASSTTTTTSSGYNPFSPNSIVSPGSTGSRGSTPGRRSSGPASSLRRTEGPQSMRGGGEPNSHRQHPYINGRGSWAGSATSPSRQGCVSVEGSPHSTRSMPSTSTPSPRSSSQTNRDRSSPSNARSGLEQQSPTGWFGGQKSPWGRQAKPGWLGDDSLSLPLAKMPKGFKVNQMDEHVMAGLRLFPCKARSDRSLGNSRSTSEFKRRYVGVSSNYFLLLGPHGHGTHMLEVRLIRYLQDISRITFKRNRPEVVTFEVLSSDESNVNPESVVCLMPDGLKECVALIKEYLAEGGIPDEVGASSPQSSSASPRELRKDFALSQPELGETDGNKFLTSSHVEASTHNALSGHTTKLETGKPSAPAEKTDFANSTSLDAGIEEFGEFQAAPHST